MSITRKELEDEMFDMRINDIIIRECCDFLDFLNNRNENYSIDISHRMFRVFKNPIQHQAVCHFFVDNYNMFIGNLNDPIFLTYKFEYFDNNLKACIFEYKLLKDLIKKFEELK